MVIALQQWLQSFEVVIALQTKLWRIACREQRRLLDQLALVPFIDLSFQLRAQVRHDLPHVLHRHSMEGSMEGSIEHSMERARSARCVDICR